MPACGSRLAATSRKQIQCTLIDLGASIATPPGRPGTEDKRGTAASDEAAATGLPSQTMALAGGRAEHSIRAHAL